MASVDTRTWRFDVQYGVDISTIMGNTWHDSGDNDVSVVQPRWRLLVLEGDVIQKERIYLGS